MKHQAGKIILGTILTVTVGVGWLYYKQQSMPIEIYVAPGKVTWQKWAATPVAVGSVEALDFDQITASILYKRDLYQRIERLHFTFAETANFEHLVRVLNNYAQAGVSSVPWRIEGGAENHYEMPGGGEGDMFGWIPDFGGEDLTLVKNQGKTACLLQIAVTPEGLRLNDVLLTDAELAIAITTCIGREKVDARLIMILADPQAPLGVATGLFRMIAAESWLHVIWVLDPEETTYRYFTGGAGAEVIANLRRLRRAMMLRNP